MINVNKNVTFFLNHIIFKYKKYIEVYRYAFETIKKSMWNCFVKNGCKSVSLGGVIPTQIAGGLQSQSSPSG